MKKYYDFDGIYNAGKKEDCGTLGIAGQKSNGKTFGALRKGLKLFLGIIDKSYEGRVIRYARRRKETVKRDNLLSLFKPHMKWVETVTDGKYNDYKMVGRRYYLCKRNMETGKIQYSDHKPFCIVNALSTWETDSGADEGEACIIVYDEAISREKALENEYDSLMKYRSNCMRDRTDYYCPVVLIGNTVTRDCTLLEEFGVNLWKLDDTAQGQIQYIYNRKGKVQFIFEWCGAVGISQEIREYYDRFENDKTKMITDGCFEVGQYKTMSKAKNALNTTCMLNVCFVHKDFKLHVQFMQHNKSGHIYIYIVEVQNAENMDLYINPLALTCNGIMLNYFDNSAAVVFRDCFLNGNVIFENSKTGDMYRSFAMNCIGLASCVPE